MSATGVETHAPCRTPAASGLLHNMSAPSRTEIRHSSRYRRPNVRGIVFRVPMDWDVSTAFGVPHGSHGRAPKDDEVRELELIRQIEEHALIMPLPAAAVVTDRAEPGDQPCEDLLSIVTVLSKSSGNVYLRDKSPNLAQLRPGRRVILIVPRDGEKQRRKE